jgi:hypothetical protein
MMVSAYTTATTVVITYNEHVTCATTADAAFAYYYTGVATDAISAAGCSGDVLTLTVSANDPPGSGANIVYTAPTTNSSSASVSATGAVPALYAATQTFSGPWTTPAMVSATVTATTIAITYNEAVACPSTFTVADFTYNSAGATSGGTVTACAAAADVLTLTGTFTLPGNAANIVYTAPGASTTANAVNATVDFPQFAATQTLVLTAAPAPAMVSAVVGATSIAITYNEAVACPSTFTVADFAYNSAGATSGGTVTACGAAADVLTLTGTFTLPGNTANIVYTAPATSTTANAVNATSDFPQFAATQTLALTAAPAPAMVSAVVGATSIAITYGAAVSCPTTGADGDFVYYYQGVSVGGVATGCTTVGDVLTLTGAFAASTGSASIVYTAPGASTTANAVYATGSTTDFAASQTLLPL